MPIQMKAQRVPRTIPAAIAFLLFATQLLGQSVAVSPSTDSRHGSVRLHAVYRYWMDYGLEKKVRWDFNEIPLKDVVDSIRRDCAIPLGLDDKALEAARLASEKQITSTETQITFQIRDVSLRTAFELLLRPLRLECLVVDEGILITTEAEFERTYLVANYSIFDLSPKKEDADELIDLLKKLAEHRGEVNAKQLAKDQNPMTEKTLAPRFVWFRGLLCVHASAPDHRLIKTQLDQLRDKLKLPQLENLHPYATWKVGKNLDLSQLQVLARDLREIRPVVPIENVSFRNSSLDDEAIDWLSQQPNVTSLDLSKTMLDSDQLWKLSKLQNLKSLKLVDRFVSVQNLEALAELKSLRHLDLGTIAPKSRRPNNSISQAAVAELQKKLPECKIVFFERPEPFAMAPKPTVPVREIEPFDTVAPKSFVGDLDDPFQISKSK